MPNPVAVALELDDAEREQLERWTRRRTSAQALALRARIVLLAAGGLKNTEIAVRLGITRGMAAKWRSRFAEHGLDGLTDEPRPGRPRTVTDEQVEEVVVKTLETSPRDATHWSTRSMAREVGLTQSAVLRIWRAFGLQPHRQQTWKLSSDPLFIEKVRGVVGLYLNPPERAVVLCVDEKSFAACRRSACGAVRAHHGLRLGRGHPGAAGRPARAPWARAPAARGRARTTRGCCRRRRPIGA
jgi:transposase